MQVRLTPADSKLQYAGRVRETIVPSAREAGLEGSTWQPDRLPAGDLFWRVTAAAPSTETSATLHPDWFRFTHRSFTDSSKK